MLRQRGYSPRTEKAYIGWIRRYIIHHRKRHPAELDVSHVTDFLNYLATVRAVSASTQNQATAALLFLYAEVLKRDIAEFGGLVRAKRPERLPVVLSHAEVATVLARMRGRTWLMASLLYGAGLRLAECASLRIKDVDLVRHEIVVRRGKGNKDRVTPLPTSLVEPLLLHLDSVRAQFDHDVRNGTGTVELPPPSSASTRTPRESGAGNGSSQPNATTSTATPASAAATTPTRPSCNARSATPREPPASPSPCRATPSATPSPPTSSKPATTSAPSKSSLDTTTSAPP